jgi:hypothetical protein
VLPDPPGEQGVRVVLDVEQGAVVVRPHQVRGDAADGVRQHLAAIQVLEPHRVLATAAGVLRVRQHPVVLADLVVADVVVVLARGQRVDV